MTTNMFGKLRVEHDEDEVAATTQVKVEASVPLFAAQPETKKKKKRPTANAEEHKEERHEDTEGFSEIKKTKVKGPREEEVEGKENRHQAKGPAPRGEVKHLREGQREFERHSGTGRGKEVSKGGAGGKGTWGNEKQYIKGEVSQYNRGYRNYNKHGGEYYNDEETYYNQALTTKQQTQEQHVETKQEEPKVTATVGVTAETEQKVAEEAKQEEGAAEGDTKRERREKKKKAGADEPAIKKEESLWTPDSVSYAEYAELQKEKNKALNQQKKVDVKKQEFDPTLKEYEQVDDSIGLGKGQKKAQAKTKVVAQTKTDEKEKALNQQIGFKIEDEQQRAYRNYDNQREEGGYQVRGRGGRGRGGRGGNRGGNQQVSAGAGFKFDASDFPELK